MYIYTHILYVYILYTYILYVYILHIYCILHTYTLCFLFLSLSKHMYILVSGMYIEEMAFIKFQAVMFVVIFLYLQS